MISSNGFSGFLAWAPSGVTRWTADGAPHDVKTDTLFPETDLRAATAGLDLAMLTPAVEPVKPAQPKVGLIIGLALVVGGLLAAGVVYLLEMMDRRVRSRGDLESRLALPSLGRLSRWQPAGGRLLPATITGPRAARALPHPW